MAEYLVASGSRKISALTSVSELSGSTSMPIVMGGSTVQISHSNFLTNNLLTKPNTFSGNNIFSGQTTIQTGSVTGNLPVSGRVTATSFTGSLSFNNLTDIPALVSGSSQVSYSQLSNIPNGIISSSAQIDVLFNIDGLVSGSSQISFNGITDKPTLVSSSQQIRNYGIFATTGSNTFVGNQNISGSITASLQQGYVLVGNSSGITEAVPTSSFGGGGSGFPFTGSAEITGSLEVTGSLGTTQTISTQILLTPQVLTGQLIVPTGFNGMLTGPVSNGGELTIENGSNLVII